MIADKEFGRAPICLPFDDIIATLTRMWRPIKAAPVKKPQRSRLTINKYNLRTVFGTDLLMDRYANETYQLTEFRARKKVLGSLEAVKSATGNAHEMFKLTTYRDPYPQGKVGVLDKGAFADLLLIEGNPIEDAEILVDKKNMRLIMKGGNIYKNTL